MYVSCQDRSTGKQCIGVAYTEGGPLGPYRFISFGPIVSRGETGGSLDPQPFADPVSGKRYLVYKNDFDKMYTKGPQLWLHELSEDGLQLVGERVPLQGPHADYQHGLLEAPYLTYHRESGTYCLFYSSGTFTTEGESSMWGCDMHENYGRRGYIGRRVEMEEKKAVVQARPVRLFYHFRVPGPHEVQIAGYFTFHLTQATQLLTPSRGTASSARTSPLDGRFCTPTRCGVSAAQAVHALSKALKAITSSSSTPWRTKAGLAALAFTDSSGRRTGVRACLGGPARASE